MTDVKYVISHRPASARPERLRRLTAAIAGLFAAGALAVLPAGDADAAPGDELTELSALPGALATLLPDAGLSNLSAELPNLLGLLGPESDLPEEQRRTACQTVVHIGDSTSVGSDDAGRVPTPEDRLSAQYERVGAEQVILDAGGGRSIVERVNGEPNAAEAIDAQLSRGVRGCWVIAMGVNDAANIAVGSNADADARIDAVMSRLNGQRVLWPTVATHSPGNPAYAETGMASFNTALTRAAARYPNLKVYDFAAVAQPTWFSDGIHYTAAGTAERNRLFATALATAYPG